MVIHLNNLIITIDGPSGSGNEKIARYIVKKYKLYHLDSGMLYRRLAKIIDKKNVKLNDNKSIKKTLNSIKSLSHRRNFTLRNEEIGKKASIIATNKVVRKFIDKQQHKIVKKILQKFKGCVIDGRDIGSKVFKNAQIKLFIEVNVEIRAKKLHKAESICTKQCKRNDNLSEKWCECMQTCMNSQDIQDLFKKFKGKSSRYGSNIYILRIKEDGFFNIRIKECEEKYTN